MTDASREQREFDKYQGFEGERTHSRRRRRCWRARKAGSAENGAASTHESSRSAPWADQSASSSRPVASPVAPLRSNDVLGVTSFAFAHETKTVPWIIREGNQPPGEPTTDRTGELPASQFRAGAKSERSGKEGPFDCSAAMNREACEFVVSRSHDTATRRRGRSGDRSVE